MSYFDSFKYIIDKLEEIDYDKIERILKESRYVYLCGNGGSSSNASHLAQDLQKMCGIKTLCLSDNTSLITAISNDINYDSVFSEQLRLFGEEGDTLIIFSGSGNSSNLLKAIDIALDKKMKIIVFVGMDGGWVKKLYENKVEYLIHIDTDMQHTEDWHLIVGHMICRKIEK